MSTKLCKQCGEEIKEQAKRCPHCKSFQSKLIPDVQSPRFFFLAFGFLIVPLVVFSFFLLKKPMKMIDKAAKGFVSEESGLSISSSRLQITTKDGTPYATIIGTIQNTSTETWGLLHFYADFHDAGGNLVDTCSDKDWGLIVLPNSKTAFKVMTQAAAKPEDYVSHTISIRHATPKSMY